jgi:hypothetical protein
MNITRDVRKSMNYNDYSRLSDLSGDMNERKTGSRIALVFCIGIILAIVAFKVFIEWFGWIFN